MKSKGSSQKQIVKVTNTISKGDDNCVDLTSDILPTPTLPTSEPSALTTKKKLRKCNCCNILFIINFNYC